MGLHLIRVFALFLEFYSQKHTKAAEVGTTLVLHRLICSLLLQQGWEHSNKYVASRTILLGDYG